MLQINFYLENPSEKKLGKAQYINPIKATHSKIASIAITPKNHINHCIYLAQLR